MPPILLSNPLFSTPTANLTPEQDALRWSSLMTTLTQIQQQLQGTVKYGTVPAAGGATIVGQNIQGSQFITSDGVRNRVEIGNLPTYTDPSGVVSPADYNMRLLDSTGKLIFDGRGAVGLPKLLNSGGVNWTATNVVGVAGPPTGISGTGGEVVLTTFTFTLTRTGTVAIVPVCTAFKVTTLGPIALLAPIYVRVTGQANGPAGGVAVANALGGATMPTSTTPIQVLSGLAANTYTVNLIWNSIEGVNCNLWYYTNLVYVFQFGS